MRYYRSAFLSECNEVDYPNSPCVNTEALLEYIIAVLEERFRKPAEAICAIDLVAFQTETRSIGARRVTIARTIMKESQRNLIIMTTIDQISVQNQSMLVCLATLSSIFLLQMHGTLGCAALTIRMIQGLGDANVLHKRPIIAPAGFQSLFQSVTMREPALPSESFAPETSFKSCRIS